jgi:hypothetical protein
MGEMGDWGTFDLGENSIMVIGYWLKSVTVTRVADSSKSPIG